MVKIFFFKVEKKPLTPTLYWSRQIIDIGISRVIEAPTRLLLYNLSYGENQYCVEGLTFGINSPNEIINFENLRKTFKKSEDGFIS